MTEWRVPAKAMLTQGWGVEDISLSLSVPVADVRALVTAMRAAGMLAEIYLDRTPSSGV
jgi:hypothetical protein